LLLTLPWLLLSGCGGSSSDTETAVREATSTGIRAQIVSPPDNIPVAIGDGVSFSAIASGGSGDYSFSWSFPGADTPSSSSQDVTVRYSKEGVFTATLVVTDDNGNRSQSTVDIVVGGSTLTAQVLSPSEGIHIDAGTPLSFLGTAFGGLADTEADYRFSWTFPDGSPATDTGASVPSVIFDSPGVYTVRFTATDRAGVRATDTVTVIVGSAPLTAMITSPGNDLSGIQSVSSAVPPATADTVNFSATATGGREPFTFRWDVPGASTATTVAGRSFSDTFADPGVSVVTLTVTDGEGNTATDAVTVTAD
jgi:PKD repeat protein